MAWIQMRPEEDVLAGTDKLARLYRSLVDPEHGVVDHVLQIHSLRPDTLDGHLRLYRSVMHSPGRLSPREREGMAVAVSARNRCHY